MRHIITLAITLPLLALACDSPYDEAELQAGYDHRTASAIASSPDEPFVGECSIQCGDGEQQVYEGEDPMCACALVAVAGKAEDVEAVLPNTLDLTAAGGGTAAPNWGSCSIICGGEGKLKCTYEGYCPRCKCSPSISCYMGSNC